MSKVLVVVDVVRVLHVVSEMLQLEGHQVVVAENGQQALARVDSQAFDLVLLDIVMPLMEGLETIERLQADQPQLPIIVISGVTQADDTDQLPAAMRLGAQAALRKPFDRNELLRVIDAVLPPQ